MGELETINEAVARKACDCISRRDVPGVMDLMSDHGSWFLVGRPDRFSYGGTKDKVGERAQLTGFFAGFSEFEFVVEATVAQGSRVAVQARSSGTGPGRRRYDNTYLIMFTIEDGLIINAKEYLDPFEVFHYLEQPE